MQQISELEKTQEYIRMKDLKRMLDERDAKDKEAGLTAPSQLHDELTAEWLKAWSVYDAKVAELSKKEDTKTPEEILARRARTRAAVDARNAPKIPQVGYTGPPNPMPDSGEFAPAPPATKWRTGCTETAGWFAGIQQS